MFEILDKIEIRNDEYRSLIESIKSKKIVCKNFVDVDGDYRFWNVSPFSFQCLQTFYAQAIDMYSKTLGKPPLHCYLMVNHIESKRTMFGSGGGWHVDSVRKQYKTFMYLTDCESTQLGPLTLLTSGNSFRDRSAILSNYLHGNKFRFSEKKVEEMRLKKFFEKPILLQKMEPFFLDTSLIHRGAPITNGERIMVTAYMFDDNVPSSIEKRLNNGD